MGASVAGSMRNPSLAAKRAALAQELTGALRTVNGDKHFRVRLRLEDDGQPSYTTIRDFDVAVGDGGVILRSVDGGESWCFLHATLDHLRSVEMISNSVALVVGENGVVLRSDTGGGDCQTAPLVAVFTDGFESGDASGWSNTIP